MSSFQNKKQLRFVITLTTGKFGSSDNNQIILEGFRAIATVDKAGGGMMGTLRARIYGITQDHINSVTAVVWQPLSRPMNTVEVYAIDGTTETLVFAGNIVNAWGDYLSMPEVFLQIQAQSAYFAGLQPVTPISISGGIPVATLMQQIATGMGLAFENNNVTATAIDVYLASTLKERALELARTYNFSLYIDDTVLAITNLYAPREGLIPQVSALSGLVGYPTFDSAGVNFRTLFNPAIRFGGSVDLVTDIARAKGQWIVTSISHFLDSEKPDGAWFSQVRGNQSGLAVAN